MWDDVMKFTNPSVSTQGIVGDLRKRDMSFSQILFQLIDSKGLIDVDVYKKANIDRRHFAKLRKKSYRPGKQTVLALAVALELTIEETASLLEHAGFSLSPIQEFDVIVTRYISKGCYDIGKINEALHKYDQPLLGG